jgi:hypothetical protein
MLLPAVHLERVKEISLRTGIPRNTIAALALDEYLQRHYPDDGCGVMVDERNEYDNLPTHGSPPVDENLQAA